MTIKNENPKSQYHKAIQNANRLFRASRFEESLIEAKRAKALEEESGHPPSALLKSIISISDIKLKPSQGKVKKPNPANEKIQPFRTNIQEDSHAVSNILIIAFTFNNDRPFGDPSVWYRCICLADRIKEKGIKCDIALEEDMKHLGGSIDSYDKIIFFRPRQTRELSLFIQDCLKKNIYIAASYDDLIFDVSTYRESSTRKAGGKTHLIHSRYRDWANAFALFKNYIVSSKFLELQILRLNPNASIYIIDNIINSDLEADINIWSDFKTDHYSIGYFGGGASHKKDIEMIQDELRIICSELNAILYLPESLCEEINIPSKHLRTFERLNYHDMLKLCAKMTICIAPLKLDLNSRAKSSIKYTEALYCRCNLVATEIDAYKPYLDSKSLFIAKDNDWHEKMTAALITENQERDYLKQIDKHQLLFSNSLNSFLKA